MVQFINATTCSAHCTVKSKSTHVMLSCRMVERTVSGIVLKRWKLWPPKSYSFVLLKISKAWKYSLSSSRALKAAMRLGVFSKASQEYAKHSWKITSRISAGSFDKVLTIPAPAAHRLWGIGQVVAWVDLRVQKLCSQRAFSATASLATAPTPSPGARAEGGSVGT